MNYELTINGARHKVEFTAPGRDSTQVRCLIDGRAVEAAAIRISPSCYSILLEGRVFEVTIDDHSGSLLLRAHGREFSVEIFDPRSWRRAHRAGVELEGRQQLVAPMPGKIVRVLVKTGEQVTAGQGLLVIEAMKMQNEVRSPKSGVVEKLAPEGRTVNAGEVLAVVT